MPESSTEMAKLQQQLTELNQSLEEAIRERTQAAQYGLQVLEEKQQLEFKCQELEAACDTLRHDYEAAKEVPFIATCLQLTCVHFSRFDNCKMCKRRSSVRICSTSSQCSMKVTIEKRNC